MPNSARSIATRNARIAQFWRQGRPVESGAAHYNLPGRVVCAIVLLFCAGFLFAHVWAFPGAAACLLTLGTVLLAFQKPVAQVLRRRWRALAAIVAAAVLGWGAWCAGLWSGTGAATGAMTDLLGGAGAGLLAGLLTLWTDHRFARTEAATQRGRLTGLVLRWQVMAAPLVCALEARLLAQGGAAGLAGLVQVEVLTLGLLTAAHFEVITLRTLSLRRGTLGPLMAVALLLAALGLVVGLPDQTAAAPRSGDALLALLVATGLLVLISVLHTRRIALTCAVTLCAGAGLVTGTFAAPAPNWSEVAILLCLGMICFAMIRFALWEMLEDPLPAEILRRFQTSEDCWVIRLDLAGRRVLFPLLSAAEPHALPFSAFFAPSETQPLLDLFREITRTAETSVAAGGAAAPALVTLTVKLPELPPRRMQIRILSLSPTDAWASLSAQDGPQDLTASAEFYEARLAQARDREEHLLAVASHELRTPVAIMSMLTEDMKSGASWNEVGLSMETTLRRLMGILDNLRTQGDGPTTGEIFTLGEIGLQLIETFSPSAPDMHIRLDLSQEGEVLLQGDAIRIIVALSKLVHNAIIHSRGSEIVISAYLSSDDPETRTASWIVKDNGVGIPAARRATLFDAFRGSGDEGLREGAPGLGLYYARKSIEMIGGRLWHDEKTTPGACFVLTHPARLLDSAPESTTDTPQKAQQAMTANTIPYPSKTALLVEDNKLVGELTANRLRRLFGEVIWSETGDEALERFRATPPDIVFVDQLLPGMSGSEFVAAARRISLSVPMIGITASTVGTECERLEAAGANMAVEKPLSFEQTKVIAAEFLGPGE